MAIESTAFPWLRHLPENEVFEFLRDLREAINKLPRDAKSLGPVDVEIASWRSTALVHADPEVREAILKALVDDSEDCCLERSYCGCGPDDSETCCMERSNCGHTSEAPEFTPQVPEVTLPEPSLEEIQAAQQRLKDLPPRGPSAFPLIVDEVQRFEATGKLDEPRLLGCGFCFEENGEEIHPHPQCKEVGVRKVKARRNCTATKKVYDGSSIVRCNKFADHIGDHVTSLGWHWPNITLGDIPGPRKGEHENDDI